MQEYASDLANEQFTASYQLLGRLVDWLAGAQAAGLTHAAVEDR